MKKTNFLPVLLFLILLVPVSSFAGWDIMETDSNQNYVLTSFFDLRERESFLQITNTVDTPARIHVQIFNVGNLCNENNFFDLYTGNDTHVYNMREILTNDGNPSGVELPGNAYGFVVFTVVDLNELILEINDGFITGNFRILDSLGYEYRSNMTGITSTSQPEGEERYTFHFNREGGITLSDVALLYIEEAENGQEYQVDDVINTFTLMDVDIVDNNEVLLSCRDVIFACVKPDDPLVPNLLANENNTGSSVASFEYGINETIPHSKGGELLCPGNIIGEGIVIMTEESRASSSSGFVTGFLGLNNGNGRGSMDSIWDIDELDFGD